MADSVRDRLARFFSEGGQAGLEGYKQSQDSKLQQLLLGQKNQQQVEQEQRNRTAYDALRKQHGPNVDIKVGDLSVGGLEKKPLKMELTPAQEAAEKVGGQELARYGAGGGSATVEKNLSLMEQTAKQLEENKPGMWTRAAGALPKTLRDFMVPEDVEREDQIRTAVQTSLREIMGPQYTEREGTEMMQRSYNPRLSAEQNMAKIRTAAQELMKRKAEKDAALSRYQKTGYATIGRDDKSKAPAAGGNDTKRRPGESIPAYNKRMGRS